MSPLTTHVLDTARGRPAAGVPVRLEIAEGEGWRLIAAGQTNADGRLPGLLPEGGLLRAVYRLTFEVDAYEESQGGRGFYPYAQVVFRVEDPASHHHVPLLLSPYGYSTYRGS